MLRVTALDDGGRGVRDLASHGWEHRPHEIASLLQRRRFRSARRFTFVGSKLSVIYKTIRLGSIPSGLERACGVLFAQWLPKGVSEASLTQQFGPVAE